MKPRYVTIISIIIILVLLFTWVISTNNKLISQDESVKSAWSQVENVYQRRSDLIPNLVQTVKGYAAHEKETFEAVIQARAAATQMKIDINKVTPEQIQKFQVSQNQLSSALGKLMVVGERYPELKANENFLDLQKQLEGTENRISVERKNFNEITQKYNTTIRSFPESFIAHIIGMQPKPYFEMQKKSSQNPEIQF